MEVPHYSEVFCTSEKQEVRFPSKTRTINCHYSEKPETSTTSPNILDRNIFFHDIATPFHKTTFTDYYADVDAIIFLVDAADRTRMGEAKVELQYLFETESLRHVPFAILGNKIDIPTACSDEELRQFLELPTSYNYYGGGGGQNTGSMRPNGGPIEVFMVSLVNKMGYSAAFRWISEVLKKQSGR